jgi:hypothetical protein
MRLFGIFCLIGTVSACGGYKTNGDTVTYTRCNEGNGCTTSAIKDADPKSFESLRGGYAKDRFRVYFNGAPMTGADPQSFKVLSDIYAKDKTHAYFENEAIAGADSESFVALDDPNYGRDRNDIYIMAQAIGVCDLHSFRWLKDDWQVDSKCAYARGMKLPNAHVESFAVINESYAKDAEHVYSSISNKSIQGADVATFKSESFCWSCGRDKNRCYDGPEPAPCGLH